MRECENEQHGRGSPPPPYIGEGGNTQGVAGHNSGASTSPLFDDGGGSTHKIKGHHYPIKLALKNPIKPLLIHLFNVTSINEYFIQ